MFVCKIFLRIHLFGEIIGQMVYLLTYYVDIYGLDATVWCSKICRTHKNNLRIDLNLEISLCYQSTDLRHKNNMLGLQWTS